MAVLCQTPYQSVILLIDSPGTPASPGRNISQLFLVRIIGSAGFKQIVFKKEKNKLLLMGISPLCPKSLPIKRGFGDSIC